MSEIEDAIKKMLADAEQMPRLSHSTMFASPRLFDDLIRVAREARHEIGTLGGIKFFVDDKLEDDVIVIERKEWVPKLTPFPDDVKDEIEIDKNIRMRMKPYFGTPTHLFYPHYPDEPVIEHPQLRIPPERWKYQYHIWTTPIRALRWLVAWLVERYSR